LSDAFRQAFVKQTPKSNSTSTTVTATTPILVESSTISPADKGVNYGSTDNANTANNTNTLAQETKTDVAASSGPTLPPVSSSTAESDQTAEDKEEKAALDAAPVQLVALGLGTPGFARKFAKQYNFAGRMYVDPSKSLFQQAGMTRGRHVTCGQCLYGCIRALALGVTRCWCQCCAGDVTQNGGVLVFDCKHQVVYQHKSAIPTDHAKPESVISAARKALASAQ